MLKDIIYIKKILNLTIILFLMQILWKEISKYRKELENKSGDKK